MNLDKEFDDLFGEMLKHRLFHYGLQHFKDIGREATKSENDECWAFADWQIEKLKHFIHQKHREYIEKKIEELKGMREQNRHYPLFLEEDGVGTDVSAGYNTALDDIIANYKKELEEV